MAPPPPELPLEPDPPEPPALAELAAGFTVTCAVPVRLELAAEIAVTVTVAGEGTTAGAMYCPEDEIVPTVEFPPVTPFTCQLTAVFVEFMTVAMNICVPVPATTAAVPGVTLTVMAGTIVTAAEAVLVVSAADVAVTVAVAGDGTAAGAL